MPRNHLYGKKYDPNEFNICCGRVLTTEPCSVPGLTERRGARDSLKKLLVFIYSRIEAYEWSLNAKKVVIYSVENGRCLLY